MPASLKTFPVSKNGVYLGYADARQIAKSNGVLQLYDESKAKSEIAATLIAAAKAEAQEDAIAIAESSAAGGADPAAVQKGPKQPK